LEREAARFTAAKQPHRFDKLKVQMQIGTDFVLRVQPGCLTRTGYGSICGQVWCESGTLAFPGPHWNDFPIVVVSWWLEAVVSLVDGRKRNADVSFMDGPYMVHVFAKHRESWQAEWVERRAAGNNVIHQFDFTPDPFIRSLMACSDDLLQECSAKGWESTDVDSVILHRERLIHYVAKNRSAH
jgi:hypothetical protein